MDEVILFTAFTWLCPKCKRRNYTKGLDVPVEDVAELETDEEGEFVSVPDEVVCRECTTHYKTKE
jgi:rubredoxin